MSRDTKVYRFPKHFDPYRNKISQLTAKDLGVLFGDDHKVLQEEAERLGIPAKDVKHYWHKSKHISMFVKNHGKTYQQIFDELKDEMIAAAPEYPKLERKQPDHGHLLVIDPADIHIGKLATAFETGDAYDVKIVSERVHEGVQGILDKTSSFNIDQILFIGGNDILHTDNAKRTTTSGTSQDTDGMWYENYLTAKDVMIQVLEKLITVADVHFLFCPSNHDYTQGFFLADVIKTWFHKNENITFDCSIAHRKYFLYGKNLIGATHGDGAKQTDLPLLMAEEAAEDWAKTKHRHIYTHHVHHKTSKDIGKVNIESLRSASGTDSWHDRNGYRSIKAIEGFLHDPEHGQIARISHIF
jgi:hypothetical protein